MTGSVSQAPAGAASTGSRPAPGGAVSDIILAGTERQIAPGETACFPFAARTAYGIPSIHDFTVSSDNPDFNPEWVRFRRSADDGYGPHYILEITPGDIGRSQYGAYPLRLSWGTAGTYRYAAAGCTLIMRPRVHAVTEPAVKIWPAAGRTGRGSGSSSCRWRTASSVFPGDSIRRPASGAETSSLPSARQACPWSAGPYARDAR
jgi:hypothetical protein